MSKVRTTIRLNGSLKEQVELKCKEERRTITSITEWLLEEWVNGNIQLGNEQKEISSEIKYQTNVPVAGDWNGPKPKNLFDV